MTITDNINLPFDRCFGEYKLFVQNVNKYDKTLYICTRSIVSYRILLFFYFPCISLFYSFVCSSHLCILSYMHVPYGAFFINKEFEFEYIDI